MTVNRFKGALSVPTLGRSTLLDGRALVLVVVLGGLFALQGSNTLDASKIVYLLLATAAVAVALAGVPWWLSEARSAIARPWVIIAGAFVALLIISLVVSRARGTSFTSWLRDASPYGLFAAAPILTLACARRASQRWLVAVLAVCGALASVSFAVEWIGRRQLAHLPIDRIALPSEALAAALLALATAIALAGASRRWWWSATAGAVLGLFFATGARSTLLLLAIPIGIAIFAGRPRLLAARVLLTEVAIAIAVFFLAESGLAFANGTLSIPLWSSMANPTSSAQPSGSPTAGSPRPTATPPDRIAQRVNELGSLINDPGSDQSLQERLTQTKVAWHTFVGSPLEGVGPGYDFQWTRTSKKVVDAYTMDTPLIYLAKFGLLGLVPLVLFIAAYLRLTLELWRRRQEARIEYLAVVGFALVLAVLSLQGSPIEDKGASFALILVLALGLRALVRRDPASELAGAPLRVGEPEGTSERGATGR
jgi:hypothetical protein